MKSRLRLMVAGLLGAAALAATGCIEVEQTLTLGHDLSGTAGLMMRVDLESMAALMARIQREMSGKTGDPSPAELEQARAEMRSSDTHTTPEGFAADKRELERNLPPGVRLVDAGFEDEGLRFTVRIALAFDTVSSLRGLKFPEDTDVRGGTRGSGDPANPAQSPFEGLEVIEDGNTVLVQFPVQNPVAGQGRGFGPMPQDAETAQQVRELFGGLRVGFRLTTPFTVVEHTAHRQEGQTLIWDYDLKKLMTLTPKAMKNGIRARFTK